LGIVGYYGKFIKDFLQIAEPLNQLLKKDRTFVWTPNCEEAFGKLKQALMSSPVLALPTQLI